MVAGVYHIVSVTHGENMGDIKVEINAAHDLFKAHFPQFPVFPGAVMVDMVKELFESMLQKKLSFKKVSVIKFLKIISPNQNKFLNIHLSWKGEHEFTLTAEITSEGNTHFKMMAVYEEVIN